MKFPVCCKLNRKLKNKKKPDAACFRIRIGYQSKVFQIPEEDASIGGARRQQKFVRVEHDFGDGCRVLTQFRQKSASSQVPYLHEFDDLIILSKIGYTVYIMNFTLT